MNFLRLPDPLLSVLYEDDDIIAIDKPYGFNAHTNDNKIEHSEFIQDGLIEIYEKQFGHKFHIIHRLDQTTTGVMIFGKSTESAKKYAQFFFDRQVKKTYLFITKSKSSKADFLIEKQIVHKGRELDAKTKLTLIKAENGFELWRANPYTGRNHQIRIHAQAAGISIWGDTKYDGAPNSFLCLHNHRIEFPNEVTIVSSPPVYFENLSLLFDSAVTQILFGWDRRRRFFQNKAIEDQCFRVLQTTIQKTAQTTDRHKHSEFTMDKFGGCLLALRDNEYWKPTNEGRFSELSAYLKMPTLVRASSEKESANSNHIVTEGQVQYEVRMNSSKHCGLSLNLRLHRNWIFKNSNNKSVLNLFCQSGTSGLAAALGQARNVTLVDSSKALLSWAKHNFELNKLDPLMFRFLCRESLSFLDQALKRNLKYDLIVFDCPSFFRLEKGLFKIETDLEKLLENSLTCLNSKGELLFSTNSNNLFIDDIRKILCKVELNLKVVKLEIHCILPSLDFELPDEAAQMKSFLVRRIE